MKITALLMLGLCLFSVVSYSQVGCEDAGDAPACDGILSSACPDMDSEGSVVWPVAGGDWDTEDFDGNGVTDRWDFLLFKTVLCSEDHPYKQSVVCAYESNLATLSLESVGPLQPYVTAYPHVLAACLTGNPEGNCLTRQFWGLTGAYYLARSSGQLLFDSLGDLDDDTITNDQEARNVMSRGGTREEFVAAALDPALDGCDGLCPPVEGEGEGEGEGECADPGNAPACDGVLTGACPDFDAEGVTLWPLVGGVWASEDFDDSGVVDSWEILLYQAVLCDENHPLHQALVCAYESNLSALALESSNPLYSYLTTYRKILAAILSGGPQGRCLTIQTWGLTGTYYLARVSGTAVFEPFTGDADGDGFTNRQEAFNVIARNGTREEFLLAALNPLLDGCDGLCPAGEGEGEGEGEPAEPLPVTYSFGPAAPLLDADFYLGVGKNGVEAVPGRFSMFGQASKDGSKVAFLMFRTDSTFADLGVVDVGNPGSWRRVATSVDYPYPYHWTPDDEYIVTWRYRYHVATGSRDVPVYTVSGGSSVDLDNPSTTSLPRDNWLVTKGWPGIVAVPILPNGDQDMTREAVQVTNLGWDTDWPAIAHDGSAVVFAKMGAYSDIYAVRDLQTIIKAPKIPGTRISSLAPTSAPDPRVVAIRANEGGIDHFAHVPLFSQDTSLVFYVEDWNGFAAWPGGFFDWMNAADFDVMISRSDGAGDDFRFAQLESQFVTSVTAGGVRLVYGTGSGSNFALYMTSLQSAADVPGDNVSNQVILLDSAVGPVEVTLGDNAIQVPAASPTALTVGDASGTVVTLPPGQVVNFPTGEPQTIAITTPVDPVTEVQLPLDAPVEAIPVVREFGPAGTNFYPPIVITMSYTDAEVAGLNETTLWPYLYNAATDMFDVRVPEADIVERNTTGNYIRFRVDHFSIYGLGGSGSSADLPLRGPVMLFLALVVVTLSARRRCLASAR